MTGEPGRAPGTANLPGGLTFTVPLGTGDGGRGGMGGNGGIGGGNQGEGGVDGGAGANGGGGLMAIAW